MPPHDTNSATLDSSNLLIIEASEAYDRWNILDSDWDEFRADEYDFHGAELNAGEEAKTREAGHVW